MQIKINKTDVLPVMIVNLVLSVLFFVYYLVMDVVSIVESCNGKLEFDGLFLLSIIIFIPNALVLRWIDNIDGIFTVSDYRIALGVRIVSYTVWAIQPILVFSGNTCAVINGLFAAVFMTIMFCCLFGKRPGSLSYIKYNFEHSNISRKNKLRRRGRC